MPKPVSEDTAMLALQQEQTAYIRQAVEDMSQKMAVQMEQRHHARHAAGAALDG